MIATREQEIWAVALCVQREHCEDAEQFIAEKGLRLQELGDDGSRSS